MQIAEHLCQEKNADGPWNFGPLDEGTATVADVVDLFHEYWGRGSWVSVSDPNSAIETPVLRLDASRAREKLGWKPRIGLNKALEMTVDWYKESARDERGPVRSHVRADTPVRRLGGVVTGRQACRACGKAASRRISRFGNTRQLLAPAENAK